MMEFFKFIFSRELLLNISFYGISFFLFFLITSLLSKFVEKKFSNNSIINSELIKHTTKPVYQMLWILFLLVVVEFFIKFYGSENESMKQIIQYIPIARSVIIIVFISLSFLSFIKSVQKNLIRSKLNDGLKPDIQKIDMISKSCSILVLLVASFGMMQALGVGFGAIATVGGLGGLIIGFSTKDLFSNFFGLFSIYLDKPFIIGDEITILDKGINGVVEEIGLRITTIRTSNNQTAVYLPNSIFNTSILENKTRVANKILDQEFKIVNTGNLEIIENLIKKLTFSLKDFDFISKVVNSRIKIEEINDEDLKLSFKIFFEPTNSEIFIKNCNIIVNFLYNEFRNNGINVISKDEKFLIKEKDKNKNYYRKLKSVGNSSILNAFSTE